MMYRGITLAVCTALIGLVVAVDPAPQVVKFNAGKTYGSAQIHLAILFLISTCSLEVSQNLSSLPTSTAVGLGFNAQRRLQACGTSMTHRL